MPLEQYVNGEAAPGPDIGLLEPVDRFLGPGDYRKNVRFGILAFKRVVRFVPGALQIDERWAKLRIAVGNARITPYC